jgi:uncharacterized membrane protein YcjF (UPF0283 family)
MPMLAEIVETRELVETIVYAFVAGVGVTVIFSVAIWGVARFVDLSQEERPLAAGAAVGVTVLALLVVVAAVVIGVIVMTSK